MIEFFIQSLAHIIISLRCFATPYFNCFSAKVVIRFQNLSEENTFSLLIKMKHAKPLTLYQIVPGTFYNPQILKYHHREWKLCIEKCILYLSIGWSAGLNHWLTADFTQSPHPAQYIKFIHQQNHKLFSVMCNNGVIFSLIMREWNQKF